jgi:hypothetical protein
VTRKPPWILPVLAVLATWGGLVLARPTPVPAPAEPAPASRSHFALQDTTFYGGTCWAPDSMRWEAIRDSAWTFDSGVGSSINLGQDPNKPAGYHATLEGWTGHDRSLYPHPDFRRHGTCALAGSFSAWAGITASEAEARCYATGQGYGNNWTVRIRKEFVYPGSGSVFLSFQYAVEAESGYDYAFAYVDTTGTGDGEVNLFAETGVVSGTASLTLAPGDRMRRDAGPFAIIFEATSDGSYSDEDGLNPTACGHTRIDDISLTGAVLDFTDFESGANGWQPVVPTTGVGDLSDLVSLADLPAPTTPCSILDDSVLVFAGPTGQHPNHQDGFALSPWIDLARHGDAGRPGLMTSADVYSRQPMCNFNFVQVAVRWYPFTCPVTGAVSVSPLVGLPSSLDFGPGDRCNPGVTRDLSGIVPPEAIEVQVAWGLRNSCHTTFSCSCSSAGSAGTQAPYIDNVRVGVFGMAATGVPDGGPADRADLLVRPNPIRSSGEIRFRLSAPANVSLAIVDLLGRKIVTLADGPFDRGTHAFAWDRRNASGARVAAGLYLGVLTAGPRTETRKILVVD